MSQKVHSFTVSINLLRHLQSFRIQIVRKHSSRLTKVFCFQKKYLSKIRIKKLIAIPSGSVLCSARVIPNSANEFILNLTYFFLTNCHLSFCSLSSVFYTAFNFLFRVFPNILQLLFWGEYSLPVASKFGTSIFVASCVVIFVSAG